MARKKSFYRRFYASRVHTQSAAALVVSERGGALSIRIVGDEWPCFDCETAANIARFITKIVKSKQLRTKKRNRATERIMALALELAGKQVEL